MEHKFLFVLMPSLPNGKRGCILQGAECGKGVRWTQWQELETRRTQRAVGLVHRCRFR